MIQRIQTLYLFLADLLISTLFILPFAEISGKEGNVFVFHLTGLVPGNGEMIVNTWPLLVISCLIFVVIVLVIFQYKKRPLQIKLTYLTMVLLLGFTCLLYFYVWKANAISGGTYSFRLASTFPLIAAVCVWLASRGIIKDEKLVRSIDRIR